MTPYALRQASEEMGISYPSAVHMRVRYLVSQIERCSLWIYETDTMPEVMLKDAQDERTNLLRSLERPVKGEVTIEMIERAKAYPVTRLIEFKHGRAKAWCHTPDKRPSLYVGTRLNLVVCPVCGLTFDAIAVQRAISGQSFKAAVLELCR